MTARVTEEDAVERIQTRVNATMHASCNLQKPVSGATQKKKKIRRSVIIITIKRRVLYTSWLCEGEGQGVEIKMKSYST